MLDLYQFIILFYKYLFSIGFSRILFIMRGNNNQNDENNNGFYQSSFSSFSKVCYSDPNNPGKMICKESRNNNGNSNTNEYSYDISRANNSNEFTNQNQSK
jgi:hypothetical protein